MADTLKETLGYAGLTPRDLQKVTSRLKAISLSKQTKDSDAIAAAKTLYTIAQQMVNWKQAGMEVTPPVLKIRNKSEVTPPAQENPLQRLKLKVG